MTTIKKNLLSSQIWKNYKIGRLLNVLENDINHSTESADNKEASIDTINTIRGLIK